MNATLTHPPLPMRHDDTRREVVAEPARPVDDGTTVSLLDGLHDSFRQRRGL
ncbi:hypothetical protein [Streptomyces celluloflavus]|uniref:hypothetical protein n=1 Tax=Streptomyces celluloflavus TaxID=58344 RepID=UPI0036BCA38D